MSIRFDHREPGTPEAEWQRVRPWSASSALDLAVDRLVVVAAHPDDETLGAGGLITIAAERDIAVTVVVLTDGLASHPEALSPSLSLIHI